MLNSLTTRFLLYIGLFSNLTILTLVSPAECKTQNEPVSDTHITRPSLDWANKPWIGDNRPYHVIREQIDHLSAQGQLTLPRLNIYRQSWEKAPRDPKILFEWVYADIIAVAHSPNMPPHTRPADGAFQEPGLTDPRTYDYERVRFLLNWNINPQELVPLGLRLAKHDPKDYPVQYCLASYYSGSETISQKDAAIIRAQNLLSRFPQKIEIYSLIGGIYYENWLYQRKVGDAQKAIFYYQRYLQLSPADDPWRKQAEFLIKYIQKQTRKSSLSKIEKLPELKN